MTYTVKEIYYTLQGEGMHTGRAAVFCRFAGCNLWTGHEQDRSTAICQFCDTEFVGTDGPGGGKFATASDLARAVRQAWSSEVSAGTPYVVCTGGEPLLQVDAALVDAFQGGGFEVGIETNGTKRAPPGVDHICVSPKAGAELKIVHGHELKLVFPQNHAAPHLFASLDFERFYLQPLDGPSRAENTQEATRYCLAHPQWRLSLQTHKLIGIP
jgi:7-carboxy-7-deazaguanine synthase